LFYKTSKCKYLSTTCKTYECPYYHEDKKDDRRDFNMLTQKPSQMQEAKKANPKKGRQTERSGKDSQKAEPMESSDAASVKAEFDTPRSVGSRVSKKKKKQPSVNFVTDSETQSMQSQPEQAE
jgi:hypothetical protein